MMRLSQAIRWFFSILFGDGLQKLQNLEQNPTTLSDSTSPAEAHPTPAAPGPSVEEARQEGREEGACIFLGLLQEEARLLDFLMEDIGPFEDAQVGAAVRHCLLYTSPSPRDS